MTGHAIGRLIFLAALLPRLLLLDSPPTGHHNWRQSDTAAVARNFAREDFNILHPRADWRADGPGLVEMEFPIYPFTVAAAYRVAGVHHWIPRVLSALVSALGAWLLFKLIEFTHARSTAIWAGAVFALMPTSVFFGRAIMPEPWMLTSLIGSVYFFARWNRSGSLGLLMASAVLTCLAVALKPPSLHIGLPLLFLAWSRLKAKCLVHPPLLAFAAFVVLTPLLWYWHASHLRAATGMTFGILTSDKWGSIGPLLTLDWYRNVILGKIGSVHLAIIGVPLLMLGIAARDRGHRDGLYRYWLIAALISIFLTPVGNAVHDYYQLPLLPAAAFFIGRSLESLWSRWPIATVVVCILAIASSSFAARQMFKKELPGRDWATPAARDLAAATIPGDLVVFVDDRPGGNPVVLYMADRKGWVLAPTAVSREQLTYAASRGAKVVIALPGRWDIDSDRDALKHATEGLTPLPTSTPDAVLFRLGP